jgi:membrane associated rhomboid family serine protease
LLLILLVLSLMLGLGDSGSAHLYGALCGFAVGAALAGLHPRRVPL